MEDKSLPKDKIELLKELKVIARDRVRDYRTTRIFALSLAYLINEIIPDDRTTKWVFRPKEDRIKGE